MFLKQRKHRLQNASIRSIIFMYFTITALAASVFIGVSLYGRLSGQMSSALQEENHILINQLGRTMDSYLRLVMKLSDSLYYGVIKNADLSDGSINGEITLLYDNNKDNVEQLVNSIEKECYDQIKSVHTQFIEEFEKGMNPQVKTQQIIKDEKTMPRWQIRTGLRRHWKKQKIFIFPCLMYSIFLIQETASIVGWYLWQEQ